MKRSTLGAEGQLSRSHDAEPGGGIILDLLRSNKFSSLSLLSSAFFSGSVPRSRLPVVVFSAP